MPVNTTEDAPHVSATGRSSGSRAWLAGAAGGVAAGLGAALLVDARPAVLLPALLVALGAAVMLMWRSGGDAASRAVEAGDASVSGTHRVAADPEPLPDAALVEAALLERTEQATRAKASSDSEARYRTVVDVLEEGIFVCAPSGIVVSCNPAAERIARVRQADWVGGSIVPAGWTPVHADGRPMRVEELPASLVLAGAGPLRNVEVGAHFRGGEAVCFEMNASPVINPHDQSLLGVVTSFIDVTHRRHLERQVAYHQERLEEEVEARTRELQVANEALERTARFNRVVTDTIPGRVSYWDAERRCRFANKGYAEWFGRRPEDFLGLTASEAFGAQYGALTPPGFEAAFRGEPVVIEREDRGADGEVHIFQSHYIPDRPPGGPLLGISVIAFDITAVKRAEADLKCMNEQLAVSRDQAEASNRAKSVFLANMSHEIRTPMNAIMGLTHVLRADAVDRVARDRLAKVADAAEHLLEIVNDILDLSKIEAGKLELEEIDFDVKELLARCTVLVEPAARAKGLEFAVDRGNLPPRLRGDPTRLTQALVNLAGNAVKFTERGSVRIECSLLASSQASRHVRFDVRDTGKGIAPHVVETLFVPFEQGDTSTTREFGGTGLGLAITKHLAQLMDGTVDVRSEVGRGSVFTLSVILGEAESESDDASDAMLSGTRALVVDDQVDVCDALSELLQCLGLDVDACYSGEDALRKAAAAQDRDEPYDVFLIDWRMPVMDGLETARRLLDDAPGERPGVLLMSGASDEPMRRSAREIGVLSVLEKPVSPSVLQEQLLRLRLKRVTLPMELTTAQSAVEVLGEQYRGARVLLAEDNPVNQEVAGALLRMAGLEVDMADTGRIAVEMARRGGHDLILMDMQMPDIDGLQATRLIRALPNLPRVPIIAMTANAFVDDRAACLDAGMDAHISKPVNPRQLYETLAHWLDVARRQAQAPVRRTSTSLRGIEGLDVARGFAMFGSREDTYRKALGQFLDIYEDGLPLVDAHLRGETVDRDKLRSEVHSLGGASAAMGATAVTALAQEIDAALSSATVTLADLRAEPLAGRLAKLPTLLADLMSAISGRLLAGIGVDFGASSEG